MISLSTETWITYGNSTCHTSKCRVHKFHQRYILKIRLSVQNTTQMLLHQTVCAEDDTNVTTWEWDCLCRRQHKCYYMGLSVQKTTQMLLHGTVCAEDNTNVTTWDCLCGRQHKCYYMGLSVQKTTQMLLHETVQKTTQMFLHETVCAEDNTNVTT